MFNINRKSEFEKVCCFTGYRPDKFPFKLERGNAEYTAFENRLIETVFSLPEEECFTFLSGMAMGFDIIAAEAVLLLKSRNPSVKLICALPFADQGAGFPEPWRKRHEKILRCADEVFNVSEEYHSGCYYRRNTFMVDNSDYVVTWFDGKRGGTENTLKYAAKKCRHIINLNGDFTEYGGGFQVSLF